MSVATIGAANVDCSDREDAPLTAEQRELVERHLYLVGVHISRRVSNAVDGRVDRDYGDLFQEGCFGLMRAARDYDPERCPSFEAYALKRIHRAVTEAIRQNSNPVKMSRRAHQKQRLKRQHEEMVSIGGESCHRDVFDEKGIGNDEGDGEVCTIGERVRAICDRALDWAAKPVIRSCRRTDERRRLVARLVEERFRIPEPSEKTPLRQIGREMGIQSAQVLRCERRLRSEVQRILSDDMELRWLLALAEEQPQGHDYPLEEDVLASLDRLAAHTFVHRLRQASCSLQEQTMIRMFSACGDMAWWSIGQMYERMHREQKDALTESLLMDAGEATYSEVA